MSKGASQHLRQIHHQQQNETQKQKQQQGWAQQHAWHNNEWLQPVLAKILANWTVLRKMNFSCENQTKAGYREGLFCSSVSPSWTQRELITVSFHSNSRSKTCFGYLLVSTSKSSTADFGKRWIELDPNLCERRGACGCLDLYCNN